MNVLIPVLAVIFIAVVLTTQTRNSHDPWIRGIPIIFVIGIIALFLGRLAFDLFSPLFTSYGQISQFLTAIVKIIGIILMIYLAFWAAVAVITLVGSLIGISFIQYTTGEKVFFDKSGQELVRTQMENDPKGQ